MAQVAHYVAMKSVERIVLLQDFVGRTIRLRDGFTTLELNARKRQPTTPCDGEVLAYCDFGRRRQQVRPLAERASTPILQHIDSKTAKLTNQSLVGVGWNTLVLP